MADEKDTSKTAATGAAPVSDEKAANTAEQYEQLTGQADSPGGDSDPVMDAIRKAEEEAVKDAPEKEEPAYINKDYEEREQVEYVDTSGDEEPEEKPAAKKTAAKKS